MTVVVFGHEKGGVGKTSLALNFTALAAENGVDVVLLDTDRQQSAANWLGLRMSSPELRKISILSNTSDPIHELNSLAARYELVVCDIGALSYKALVECGLLADLYIIPTGTSDLDLTPAESLVSVIRKLPTPGRSSVDVRCLVTKAPSNPKSTEVLKTRERLGASDIPVLDTVIAARSAWRSMANTGKALHELKGKARDEKAVEEVQALYNEVIRILSAKEEQRAAI